MSGLIFLRQLTGHGHYDSMCGSKPTRDSRRAYDVQPDKADNHSSFSVSLTLRRSGHEISQEKGEDDQSVPSGTSRVGRPVEEWSMRRQQEV